MREKSVWWVAASRKMFLGIHCAPLARWPFVLAVVMILLLARGVVADDLASDGAQINQLNLIKIRPGEKLNYALYWSGITVGWARLEVLDGTQTVGKPALYLRLTAQTTGVADFIYKVRDVIESYTDLGVTQSFLYKKSQREGRRSRDDVAIFDWDKRIVSCYSRGQLTDTIGVTPGTLDPLSILYAFRQVPIVIGLAAEAPVTDGKKWVMSIAHIIKREPVEVKAGRFDTFLLEPDLRHVGGVFEKSPNAKVQVWITCDDRRLVAKVTSKVIVGYFTAELVSFESFPDAKGR